MSRFYIYFLASSIFLGAFTWGCKKDDAVAADELTGKYTPSSTMELITTPQMYTRNGLVADNSVVSAFLTRWSASAPYNVTAVPPEAPVVTLQFLENKLVKVTKNEPIGPMSFHAEVFDRNSSGFSVRQLDSLVYYRIATVDSCEYLSDMISGAEKITVCTPVPAGFVCKYRPQFSIKIENGQFYQYLTTYTAKNTFNNGISFPGVPPQDSYCVRTIYNSWDNFDPSIISRLGVRDTIVIQRKRVKLNKQ